MTCVKTLKSTAGVLQPLSMPNTQSQSCREFRNEIEKTRPLPCVYWELQPYFKDDMASLDVDLLAWQYCCQQWLLVCLPPPKCSCITARAWHLRSLSVERVYRTAWHRTLRPLREGFPMSSCVQHQNTFSHAFRGKKAYFSLQEMLLKACWVNALCAHMHYCIFST